VNKVFKMDFKGQTAVLSAMLVLVGMVFLVPAITEKALGGIHATASGECGTKTQTHPCQFTLIGRHLGPGTWISQPTPSGTRVTWSTGGNVGDEIGWVLYNVEGGTAKLYFINPLVGSNECHLYELSAGMTGTCHAGEGQNAEFTYNLRGFELK
jgi:hypothetical protein